MIAFPCQGVVIASLEGADRVADEETHRRPMVLPVAVEV
jgi:hypothetical protein